METNSASKGIHVDDVDVKRYERADCTLFRTPPVDVSSVGSIIEKALVRAWEQGESADYALDYLLREGSITDKLAQQIAQSLQFQRQRALETVDEEKARAIGQYAAEREQLLQSIEEALGTSIRQRQEGLQRTMGEARQQTAAYSATQLQLNELRTRVKSQISELGGVQGYNVLSRIREELIQDQDQGQEEGQIGQVKKGEEGRDYRKRPVRQRQELAGSASDLEEIIEREPTKLGRLWKTLVNVVTLRYLRK
ncbi:hypothetical protein HYV85_03495 [Candidatus Woesearchaeota archaeon]|nr:hypothetical protein [Candidatus Woesearchaeota archaeon]